MHRLHNLGIFFYYLFTSYNIIPTEEANIPETDNARLYQPTQQPPKLQETLADKIFLIGDYGGAWKDIKHRAKDTSLAVISGSLKKGSEYFDKMSGITKRKILKYGQARNCELCKTNVPHEHRADETIKVPNYTGSTIDDVQVLKLEDGRLQ